MAKAILELEMPESCWDCPLVQGRELSPTTWCGYSGKDCPAPAYQGRRPDCPLKLVEDKEVEALRKAREAIQRAKENFEPYGEYEYDVRYDLEEALAEIDKAIGGKEDV